jgi:hypothetical protein
VPLLPIPEAVDNALGALAGRRALTPDLAALIQSIGRHVIRAFSQTTPITTEIDKIYARIEQCYVVLRANPSADADATIAADLKRLAGALVAAERGRAPKRAPAAPAASSPIVAVAVAVEAQPAALPSFQPRPPAAAKPAAEPIRQTQSIVVGVFAESSAARAERDWYWFVLEELNGLGTLLEFQRQEGAAAAATRTEQRIRVMLETLGWDPPAALRQTWAFVEQRLRDADDIWGPHLVLFALEPVADRVRDWRSKLPVEMQATIGRTNLETVWGKT